MVDIFEHFPFELWEAILQRLSVADLINCCKVSSVWRSHVNSDLIWLHQCQKRLFTAATMEKYKSVIFDTYNYDPDSTRLEPLCYWRLVYAVNKQLTKRWYDAQWCRIKTKGTSQVYCLDYDEERLVFSCEDGSINVCTIHLKMESKEMKLLSKYCILKGTPVTSIKLCNAYILALQKQLLQIYKIIDDSISLVGICSYELGESNMDLMDQVVRLGENFDHWYKECLRNYDSYPIRRLNFLPYKNLCFASVGGSEAVDIWTIEGQSKAYLSGFRNVRSIVQNCDEVYILSGDNPTVISRYCWSRNEAEKVISVSGFKRIVFGEQYILAIPHPSDMKMTMLWVWNKTYSLVRTKVLSSSIVSAFSTSLVVYTENSLVTVWNPRTNIVLKTFSVGASIGFMKHAHSSILVLFVNASLDVWDFLKGRRLSRLYSRLEWSGDFRDLLWISPSTVIAGGVRKNLQILRCFCNKK